MITVFPRNGVVMSPHQPNGLVELLGLPGGDSVEFLVVVLGPIVSPHAIFGRDSAVGTQKPVAKGRPGVMRNVNVDQQTNPVAVILHLNLGQSGGRV